MAKLDWENVTHYIDTVDTTPKTFSFSKPQDYVKVTTKGNANITYTIGTQSGTLTPGQSKEVSEVLSSFTLTAVSGTQTIEVYAKEAGTEKEESTPTLPSDVAGKIEELTSSLAQSTTEIQKVSESPFVTQTVNTPKPILVFVDDDGLLATWNKTREIFNRKGKKFVAAITTGKVGQSGYMTLDQVKLLQSEGHEISSHHVTHVQMTDALLPEIGESKQWFRDNKITCETLTWVGGAYSDKSITEAKKYYKAALSVEYGQNKTPVRQFIMKRYAVGSMFNGSTIDGIVADGSQTQYNAMVDLAKNNNSLVIAMMHNWQAQFDSTQQTRLEAMIDYADAQGVEIMTISAALKYFGNVIDIGTDALGYFRVGSDGKISNPSLLDKMIYKNLGFNPSITMSTLGTSFEKGFVSVATFDQASVSGFPEDHAGVLETYYTNDIYNIHQKWYPFNKNTIWFRQWHYSTGWKEFSKLSFESKPPTTTINVATKTINANSVVEVRIPHPNNIGIDSGNDLVVATPIGGLENNVIYSVSMWADGACTIIIRLYNPTASTITTAARDWRVKILK
jgi:peptidoglycan/xylan/chitin deacetylase (PgdA/CDA1 family)